MQLLKNEAGRGISGVVSEVASSLTVCLVEAYPDGDRPARPGFPHAKRNAQWQEPHHITSMIESKAVATVGAAYPRRCAGWRGAGCFCSQPGFN